MKPFKFFKESTNTSEHEIVAVVGTREMYRRWLLDNFQVDVGDGNTYKVGKTTYRCVNNLYRVRGYLYKGMIELHGASEWVTNYDEIVESVRMSVWSFR
jgi:hypothetical protein